MRSTSGARYLREPMPLVSLRAVIVHIILCWRTIRHDRQQCACCACINSEELGVSVHTYMRRPWHSAHQARARDVIIHVGGPSHRASARQSNYNNIDYPCTHARGYTKAYRRGGAASSIHRVGRAAAAAVWQQGRQQQAACCTHQSSPHSEIRWASPKSPSFARPSGESRQLSCAR